MPSPAAVPLPASPPRRWQRPLVALLGVGIVGAALLWTALRNPATRAPITEELAVFDSYARITLWTDAKTAEPALRECAICLAELHRALNRWDPTGELAQLNETAAKEPFACSPRLWDALLAARQAYRQTQGAFDVSVGPIMAVWGLHRKRDTIPSEAEIEAALGRVGLDRVQFDDAHHSVRFPSDGMSLDLGGIAKGYALDAVTAILKRHQIDRSLVDLGGNVACTALTPPGRDHFIIGIRNPFSLNDLLGRMPVVGRAVSTSGNYERRIVLQGKEIGHIVDPRTGRPVTGPAGVTALTPSGTDSDVFSTAVYVGGRELAEALVREVPGTGFVLVSGTPEAPVLDLVGEVQLLDDAEHPASAEAAPSP